VVDELDDHAAVVEQVVEYVARRSNERKVMDLSASTWKPRPGDQVRVVSTGEIGVIVERDSSILGEDSYAVTITSSSGRLAPAGTRNVSIRHLEPWR
jgi:hypothetical protein